MTTWTDGPVCGCCGTVTLAPNPGSGEEGDYCEGCGTAWIEGQAQNVPPQSCLLHKALTA